MKIRILLLAVLFSFGMVSVYAQTPTFVKGDKVLNLGIGFGGNYYSGYGSGITRTPLLSASLDVGVVDNVLEKGSIGVGGSIAYKGYKYDSGYGYGWNSSNLVIGPRGTFHYPLADKLDTYLGLLLAFHIVSEKQTGDWGGVNYSSASSGVYLSGFIGARYYFTNSFGVMVEFGSGSLAFGNFGITFKF